MDDYHYSTVTWYLVFENTDRSYWYDRLLTPGFQHVWAFRIDGDNVIAVSPQQSQTDVDVVPLEHARIVTDWSHILQIDAKCIRQRMRVPWLLMPFTCVEVVKALLGIRHWCLTPYQLYRYLMMTDLKGIIAEGVAEGMHTAHLNKTPEEHNDEHPDIEGLSVKSLVNRIKGDE